MLSDLQRMLKETNPFAHFDETRRTEIASLARQRRFDKGEFVTLHGELWPYLILVKEGTIHGVKESEEGRNLVVITLTQGDVFWGLSFFEEDSTMPVSLQSVKSGSLVSWSRDDLLPFLLANGEALWSLCGLLIMRMKQASNIVESLAFQPVAGRLANLMLERYGNKGEDARPHPGYDGRVCRDNPRDGMPDSLPLLRRKPDPYHPHGVLDQGSRRARCFSRLQSGWLDVERQPIFHT